MKRSPLRRVSKKRKKLNAERHTFVSEQLSKRELCEAGEKIGAHLGYTGRWPECTHFSVTLHEPLTRARAPGSETILDEANSVAICSHCHDWVHVHPSKAESMGLLRSSRGLVQ